MAASSSIAVDSLLPMNTVMHMITIRLSSSNFLLWKNQLLPLLTYQNLVHHVDGSSTLPSAKISVDGKPFPNPAYAAWIAADQRVVILLQASLASLTTEAFSEIVGFTTARQIWVALEHAYNNSSVERIQNLCDQLRLLSKGTSPVSDFSRKFKLICDQLSAIGQPASDSDKTHWYLCGFGAAFETFSTAIRTSRAPLRFHDLTAQAEGDELFLKTIHSSSSPPVAFSAQTCNNPSASNRGRNGRSSSGGRGQGWRPSPPPLSTLSHQWPLRERVSETCLVFLSCA